ncbi:MAG: dienelactone hydrolase family protein [Acidimicrobiia bacterium]|nr:dienelactone hydrolase family protein [Acidimicrobiia bacterium]MDH5519258.1 dienelactone hydrolase family protein [Acidimicrobiia bacterium]
MTNIEAMTQLTASDGHQLDAYEVDPDGATAVVVIVQEIFGVNSHIRSVVDRYASFGYRAIAPAMFDRVERGVELGYDAEGVEQGRALRQKLSWDDSVLDVAAAVEHVSGTGPVAVIGYCYGGSMAWLAAASLPIAAAVGYYGGQIVDFIDRTPRVPTMLHFGALDHAIPLGGVRAVAERHPEVIVHIYDDAGHGFSCDVRGSYHPEAAALAEERTREFLARHLTTELS